MKIHPEQVVAALGAYIGTGDEAEHTSEVERLGADSYRMRWPTALLGAA